MTRDTAKQEQGAADEWCVTVAEQIQEIVQRKHGITLGSIMLAQCIRAAHAAAHCAADQQSGVIMPEKCVRMKLDDLIAELEKARKVASGNTCVSFERLCWGSVSLWYQTHHENAQTAKRHPNALSEYILEKCGKVCTGDDFITQVMEYVERLDAPRAAEQGRERVGNGLDRAEMDRRELYDRARIDTTARPASPEADEGKNDEAAALKVDRLKSAVRGIMDSFEAHIALRDQKPESEWDEYDEMMIPKWRALDAALKECE
jgi:hypothetical protein